MLQEVMTLKLIRIPCCKIKGFIIETNTIAISKYIPSFLLL